MLAHLETIDVAEVGVVHADPAELEDFVASIEERGFADPKRYRLGPVVGTHAGPGVLGIVYRTK